MIEVKKLDGSSMHLNEDLIGRVEGAAGAQSVIYLLDGAHIIVADVPSSVVAMIRAEKVALLQRVLRGPEEPEEEPRHAGSGVTRLSQVRDQ